MTSRDDDLTARIRQQTESTMQEHGETLRASANNELRITEADIKQVHGQIRDMLPRTLTRGPSTASSRSRAVVASSPVAPVSVWTRITPD